MILRMRQWTQAVTGLKGQSRNTAAFMFGVAAAFTLPPFFIFPLIIMAYGGLFLLANKAHDARRAFADGWWWGWGYYIVGLYWFCIALMTEPDKFAWMLPFTLFGVTAFVALYPALACLIFYKIAVQGTIRRMFLFAAVWTCVEYARGYLFTGFPWNIAGNSFAYSDNAIQLASIFGAYGLTFWAVLLGVSLTVIIDIRLRVEHVILFLGLVWSGFFTGLNYGSQRLEQADKVPQAERYVPGVMLRLVQPNIAQAHRWDPAKQMEGLQKHIQMTQSSGLSLVSHVIWPESSIPYVLKPGTPLLGMIGSALPEKTLLVTGALRSQGEKESWQVYNSMVVVNRKGEIIGNYDKSKLVPFGEFLPFRSLIPKAWQTPVGDMDFTRGNGVENMEWPGLPALRPMICYEVIFPQWAHSDDDASRPKWMLNVTNDAWFGLSTGPHQHFHMARMRAAEQGLPLVRAANTGISAVIDPYGRVEAMMPLGREGILDVQLPKEAANTPYNRYNFLYLPSIMLLIIMLFFI
jgi:apolipoprotein N-acyltransferase